MPRFRDFPALLASCRELERPALTYYEGRTLAGALTYQDLAERVAHVAGALWHKLGLRAGDRIAILAPNRLEVPVLMLALMQIGAAAVPLNPGSPPDEWAYIIGHSGARGCFATDDLAAKLPPAAGVFVRPLADVLALATSAAPDAPVAAANVGDAMAVILYTSGTTGRPKGVVLPQRALLANAWSMAENFGLHETTQYAVLPLYHAHAFGFGLMTALSTAGHLVFSDRFDPFAWAEIIRTQQVEITSVVPTLLPPLLQVKVTADRVPSLRAILVSSAPLGAQLAREFETRVKIPLVQGWGLSEYTNFACCMPLAFDSADAREQLMYGGDVPSIGSPLVGTEVRVDDGHGGAAPANTRGELCIRGHSTMLSYLADPDATGKALDADGWLHTGDEGYYIEHTGKPRFFISGRIKEIIIRGGDKHSPIALERVVTAAVPELLGKLAILGFPHAAQGEEIGAYVERDVATADVRARLTAALDAMTAEQRPKIVLFGAAPIPRTHTGKVQRRKLLPLFEAHAQTRGATKYLDV